MRGLITALRRKLGLIRSCGVIAFLPDSVRVDSFTVGNPAFIGTDKDIKGPLWPSMWENLSWVADNPPHEAVGDPSMESWSYSI